MQLEAKKLSYRYGCYPWLFREVDFTLSPGEVVGLLGPSGSGKTTLCRILAGYVKPAEGRVLLGGKPITRKGYQPVQLVFQHPEKALNPRWRMRKVLKEAEVEDSILEALGIQSEWLSHFPGELSGGELQRFCVARALGKGTRFLIADEMTTMLDAITQAQIWNAVLNAQKQREMGIVVVSHEEKLVARLCDRVMRLSR
ncbi:ABC transporter ATP-binding protein [Bacillus massilinigeriensis]|uniref:ABC transporter ATP-binding protein n=1 Tax=Bacillus mediterraneensis TaxID=1805474 RepID=UPI0008F8A747|nr:ATP-binding cassette domain-containing protein [Bacillus mediterraneensis]